jgi:hypothetical protein
VRETLSLRAASNSVITRKSSSGDTRLWVQGSRTRARRPLDENELVEAGDVEEGRGMR